jgi:hypothetical protein
MPLERADADTSVRTCHSVNRKIDKVTKWADRLWFKDPDNGILYIREDQIRYVGYLVIADARYQWCPRGSRPDLVRPKWLRFCYTQVNEQGRVIGKFALFQGVSFRARFDDDYVATEPGWHKVDEDGDQNCEVQKLNYTKQRWLRLDQTPGYKVDVKFHVAMRDDDNYVFKMRRKGTPYRFMRPKLDADVWPLNYWYN